MPARQTVLLQNFAVKVHLSGGDIPRCVSASENTKSEFRKMKTELHQQNCNSCRNDQGHVLSVKNTWLLSQQNAKPSKRIFMRPFGTSQTLNTAAHIDASKNYYHILGVTPSCSDIKIKQAYYRLSKVYHPDINKTQAAVEKFHEITEAYEILSSPTLKHLYDSGRRGHSHGVHRGAHHHPVNFKARGPHQYGRTDKYNYDAWMKEHYSEMFTRASKDSVRQGDYDKVKDSFSVKNRVKTEESNFAPKHALMTVCTVMVILYTIIKFKKF